MCGVSGAIAVVYLVIVAATLGLVPFVPEPHIWEKIKMIKSGTVRCPIDVFDFLLHAAPFVALAAKLVQMQSFESEPNILKIFGKIL